MCGSRFLILAVRHAKLPIQPDNRPYQCSESDERDQVTGPFERGGAEAFFVRPIDLAYGAESEDVTERSNRDDPWIG